MNVNTETLVPISEANQNFSKVTRLVDNYGTVIILKNNEPRYVIMEFNQADSLQESDDAEVARISKQLMERNKAVYAELAK